VGSPLLALAIFARVSACSGSSSTRPQETTATTAATVARSAVTRLEERRRIYKESGAPGGRWSDPGLRDWG